MVGEENEEAKEIVGMIRGCIKTVTCGKKLSRNGRTSNDPTKPLPVYTKLAYILGLRVSPSHRYTPTLLSISLFYSLTRIQIFTKYGY